MFIGLDNAPCAEAVQVMRDYALITFPALRTEIELFRSLFMLRQYRRALLWQMFWQGAGSPMNLMGEMDCIAECRRIFQEKGKRN